MLRHVPSLLVLLAVVGTTDLPRRADADGARACASAQGAGYRWQARTDQSVPGDPSQVQVTTPLTMLGWAAPQGEANEASSDDQPRQPGKEQQFFDVAGLLGAVYLLPDDTVRADVLDLNDPTQSISAEIPAGGDQTPFCTPRLALFDQLGIDPTVQPSDTQPIWARDASQPAIGVDVTGKALYDADSCDTSVNPGACWTIQPIVKLSVLSADDVARLMNSANQVPASPPPGATIALAFVATPGADPTAIVTRIAGPAAYFRRAALSGSNPPPGVAQRLLRTYAIPAAPGTEQQLLDRARTDPQVESAQLVRWPLIIPM
jgi:hypothetical protein